MKLCTLAVVLFGTIAVADEKLRDLGHGWEEKKKDDGRVVQEMKIEAPAMTEEDQYGFVMPDRYRCDSCKAVMFHLDHELRKRHPRSRKMKEWEYTDLFEETCRGGFDGYGIKLIDGENTLSGPGLKQAENLAPGSGAIQMGGETWSKRLGEICRKIVFEKVGEEEIYLRFYNGLTPEEKAGAAPADGAERGLSEAFCASSDIRDCTIGPKVKKQTKKSANGHTNKKEDKKKMKKDKDADKKSKEQKKRAEKEQKQRDEEQRETERLVNAALARKEKEQNNAEIAQTGADSDERIDVQSFLRSLAVKHGLDAGEYLASRSQREWEKLTVAMAGRIFNKMEL